MAQCQDLEQCQCFLGFFEGGNILQHGLGLAVLRDDQRLPLLGKLRQHLGCVGLEIADGFDMR
ncbi:hypothetical protein BL243_24595 [Ralstonia solanacearum]|nr:hypothetical protein BL243_24595 [Ralstonia solanacearum]